MQLLCVTAVGYHVSIYVVVAGNHHYTRRRTAELLPNAVNPVARKGIFICLTAIGDISGYYYAVKLLHARPDAAEVSLQFIADFHIRIVNIAGHALSEMDVRQVNERQICAVGDLVHISFDQGDGRKVRCSLYLKMLHLTSRSRGQGTPNGRRLLLPERRPSLGARLSTLPLAFFCTHRCVAASAASCFGCHPQPALNSAITGTPGGPGVWRRNRHACFPEGRSAPVERPLVRFGRWRMRRRFLRT